VPVDLNEEHVLLYDSNGVEMAVQNGIAIPVDTRAYLLAGRDSSNVARVLATDSSGNLAISPGTTYSSFWVVYDRIAPAANKYMATLFNTSATRKVVVQNIWQYNWQFTGVADNLLEQELWKISARTAGTSITPRAEDTNDVLSAGITADTNSSAVTQVNLIMRIITGSAEASIAGGEAGLKIMRTTEALALLYSRKDATRGWTLRQNQGIAVRNITNITVGTCSYVIEFTDEAA
jgi:hypothetical protein